MTYSKNLPSSVAQRPREIDNELVCGVENSDVGVVRRALDRGGDPNCTMDYVSPKKGNKFSNIPVLHIAVGHDDVAVASALLLSPDIQVEKPGVNGKSALLSAVMKANIAMIKLLIGHGANINLPSGKFNNTPLTQAVLDKNSDIVLLLLKHGSNINLVSGTDSNTPTPTPLSAAVIRNNSALVLLLLQHNDDPNLAITGVSARPPLVEAALKGSTEVCRVLLENGADPNRKETQGLHSIAAAAERGHEDVVELLIKHGGDPKVLVEGQTASMVARERGHESIADYLEQHTK